MACADWIVMAAWIVMIVGDVLAVYLLSILPTTDKPGPMPF